MLTPNSKIKAVILAAGKGSRMKSDKPKVLHEIFSKPLLQRVLEAIEDINPNEPPKSIVVVGCGADLVENFVSKNFPSAKCVLQKEQLGTGHAVSMAIPELSDFCGTVLITCGDTPLLKAETLKKMVDFHLEKNADVTVMSAILDNPTGYGRIIREASGEVDKIVEQKDASEEQAKVKEVNAGVYCLNWAQVKGAFSELKNNNAQGEYYLTDIIEWAKAKGKKAFSFVIEDENEILGINSRLQLLQATEIIKNEKLESLMEQGVTIMDTSSISISPETTIGKDTVIYPNTFITGSNVIGSNCKIGPFSHFRGNVEVGNNSKVGNFVELKNAKIGDNTNVCHLSYVGDATIGNHVNIGAGTIFANYNSITKEKKRSTLKDGVSIGSNSVLVAPVELGENAFVGALSVITKNVDENSLALTRAPQRELKGWVCTQKENCLNQNKENN